MPSSSLDAALKMFYWILLEGAKGKQKKKGLEYSQEELQEMKWKDEKKLYMGQEKGEAIAGRTKGVSSKGINMLI